MNTFLLLRDDLAPVLPHPLACDVPEAEVGPVGVEICLVYPHGWRTYMTELSMLHTQPHIVVGVADGLAPEVGEVGGEWVVVVLAAHLGLEGDEEVALGEGLGLPRGGVDCPLQGWGEQ